MTLKRDLFFDHYVGAPIAYILNIGARILGKLLNRNHTLNNNLQNIYIIKFVGLGSFVHFAFLVKALKERYPEAKITLITFPPLVPLKEFYPFIDEVLVFQRKLSTLPIELIKFFINCLKVTPELVIDMEVHSKFSSIVSTLSLGVNRAGFGGQTSRFRRGLYTHLVYWNPRRPVDQAYQILGNALNLNVLPTLIKPTLSSNYNSEVETKLKEFKINLERDLIIGINPNAGELALERRWPIEYFATLINALPNNQNIVVILTGAKDEYNYCQQLYELSSSSKVKVYNLAGSFTLGASITLLKYFKLFITNDTGPLHFAGALDIHTISLWGPTHPAVYAPKNNKNLSLYKPIYCSPCTHFSDEPPCGGNNVCLKNISPKLVLRGIESKLGIKLIDNDFNATSDIENKDNKIIIGYWARDTVPLS